MKVQLDRQAAEIFLKMARIFRNARHNQAPPAVIAEKLATGEVAARHLGLLADVAILGPISVSELAEREGAALSTVSLILTQLERAGLVERREDDADRRRTMVSVAPDHFEETQEVVAAKLEPFDRAIKKMGEKKADVLLDGLQMLLEEIILTGNAQEK